MIGIGSYEVRVRMGGPGIRDPLPTTITVGGEEIAIGEVGVMRVYRFLAPTDARGALAVIVKSAMVQPPGDSRMHLQETFSDVVKTDKTGLSKTAHTRWMISAFANFLPGSTIFRLA